MKVNVTLIFTPDGNGRCLYSEIIDLSGIGPLSMRRATTIEFDDAIQRWIVRSLDGVRLFDNPSRQVCLDWEREHLEQQESLKHGTNKRQRNNRHERQNDNDNDNDNARRAT